MSDTLFFVASKLVGALIRPETWLVLGVLLTWLLGLRGRGQWMGFATLCATLLVAVFPLGELILSRLEAEYPARPELSDITGIIVLGGGEATGPAARWSGEPLNEAGERFVEGVALAREHPEARLVFTGGSGALRDLGQQSGAQAGLAERLFLRLGVARDRLVLETRSRNTAENARLSHDLLDPKAGETWVLVTSAFHMPRAMRSFERAGWPGLVAWPVDHRTQAFRRGIGWNLAENLARLNTAMKEVVGLLAYEWSGR